MTAQTTEAEGEEAQPRHDVQRGGVEDGLHHRCAGEEELGDDLDERPAQDPAVAQQAEPVSRLGERPAVEEVEHGYRKEEIERGCTGLLERPPFCCSHVKSVQVVATSSTAARTVRRTSRASAMAAWVLEAAGA